MSHQVHEILTTAAEWALSFLGMLGRHLIVDGTEHITHEKGAGSAGRSAYALAFRASSLPW